MNRMRDGRPDRSVSPQFIDDRPVAGPRRRLNRAIIAKLNTSARRRPELLMVDPAIRARGNPQ